MEGLRKTMKLCQAFRVHRFDSDQDKVTRPEISVSLSSIILWPLPH